jgi:flagellin-specific chaperone FliS
MTLADRIQEFLKRLTPLARGNLLIELERLEVCDSKIPGSAEVLAKLRAEFRKDGSTQNPIGNPSRYFFAPLEPLLIDGAPEHANSGRILRGSLSPIWEWISRDLLPTMTRDYVRAIDELIAAGNQRKARQVAVTFQTKVVKSLENTIGSLDGAKQIRAKLATYTTSHAAYDDLTKMLCVLRARDALAKFSDALPATIGKFDDAPVSKVTALLDALRKKHAEVLPFALALVASRLRTPWQLIRLATKAAPSKKAADIAATPYAIAVSMVLDRLEDKRSALRVALRNNRVLVCKEILTHIYDTEYALQISIDLLDESDWGERLRNLMNAIATLVEAEVSRFPDNIGHVLGSRSLRSRQSLAGRLSYLAWKGRDAMRGGAAYCKKLIAES